MTIKAVFFDLYNTLAGFEPSRYKIQSQAAANFGITLTHKGTLKGYAEADAYMSAENATNPVRLRNQEGKDKFFARYEQLVLKGSGIKVTPEQALKIFQRVRQIPYRLVSFTDVPPVMARLKSLQLILGIISNLDQDGDKLTANLCLSNYVNFTVTSKEVASEKPSPIVFHAALTKAGVEPSEAIHVGDQLTSDIEGASKVGINPILLDRDGNHKEFDSCPRISTLLQLPEILKCSLR